MTRRLLSGWLLVALLLCQGPLNAQIEPLSIGLSEQEREWIGAHPILRVGVFEDLQPFEYMHHGELRGLAAKYLQAVSRHTGLRFVPVVTGTRDERRNMLLNGEVDILTTRRTSARSSADHGMLYTKPYNNSSTILVSRFSGEPFVDLEHLAGQRIVMLGREGYAPLLKAKIPGAVVIPAKNAVDMLKMVDEGTADTAIAAEWLLIPYLTRQYNGVLKVSGMAPTLHTGVSMAVRESDAILLSILEKTLAFINDNERKGIYDAWLAEMDMDIPTIQVIVEHFEFEIWLLLAVLLLLTMLVLQARSLRHRAIRSQQSQAMFLAVMSHEVRSPMNAVLAAVELLQHSRLDDAQRKLIELVSGAANKMLRLVDEVLDFCKLEAGKLQLAPVAVDIEPLVHRLVDSNLPAAEKKGLALRLTRVETIPTLLLDQYRVEQALHKLVASAIQATGHGEIELQLQARGPACDGGEHVVFRLTSADVGLSKELQSVLRSSTAQIKSPSGDGYYTELGLVIFRNLVQLMNGDIVLVNDVGAGTCVDVIFPMVRAPFMAPEPISEPHSEVGVGIATDTWVQVLVVEEPTVHRQTLIEQLLGVGCSVLPADNISQGLALIQEHPVDLVLFDWPLLVPDPGAVEAFHEILLQRQRPCPFIALRSLEEQPHFAECFDATMDGVLSKPVQQEPLLQMLEMWCGPFPVCGVGIVHEEQAPQRCPAFGESLGRLVEAVALRDADSVTQALGALREAWPEDDVIAHVGEGMEGLLLSATNNWPVEALAQYLGILLEHRIKN